MLVSHRYKFIYTKTFKTGGTSVESYFERYCMPEGEWTFRHERPEYSSAAGIIGFRRDDQDTEVGRPPGCRWWNHMPAELIRKQLGEDVWSRYFKFCVVRNPFDKVVSAYCYAMRHVAAQTSLTPAAFERWVTTTRLGAKADRLKYTIDGLYCMDQAVRYESLEADLKRVCERLGVPWEGAQLQRLKSGHRPPGATPAALYTPAARDKVAAAFAFELEQFGYSDVPPGR